MNPMLDINLKAISQFLQLADSGNYGRAAVKLHLDQPSLSRAIRRLEDQLGFKLFKRYPKRLVLTEEGQRFWKLGSSTVDGFARLAASKDATRPASAIRLGIPEILGPLLSIFSFREFEADFRSHQFIISEHSSATLEQMILSGEINIGIMYDAMSISDLNTDVFALEELVLVSPPMWNCPSKDDWLTPRQIADLPLVLPSQKSGIRRAIVMTGRSHNLNLDPLVEIDGSASMKAMVRSGVGHTISTLQSINEEVKRGSLSFRRIKNPSISVRLGVSTRSDDSYVECLFARSNQLRAALVDFVGKGCWPGAIATSSSGML